MVWWSYGTATEYDGTLYTSMTYFYKVSLLRVFYSNGLSFPYFYTVFSNCLLKNVFFAKLLCNIARSSTEMYVR